MRNSNISPEIIENMKRLKDIIARNSEKEEKEMVSYNEDSYVFSGKEHGYCFISKTK